MKNKKRTIVLALAGLLSAGALTGVAVESFGGGLANVFAGDNEDSYIWNHYAAVAPTVNRHGSKEFWANCSVLGQVVFEQPTKGTINEGPAFETTDYFAKLESTDPRYIAPNEVAVVETLTKDNVTFGDTTEYYSFSNTFDKFSWGGSAVNQTLKAEKIAEFGGQSRENDGIFVYTHTKDIAAYSTPSITLPKINFQNLLKNGEKVAMEFGCYTGEGYVRFHDKEIFNNNGKGSHIYGLTRVKAYFYQDGESVKVSFIVSTRNKDKDETHTEVQKVGDKETTVTIVDSENHQSYSVTEVVETLTAEEANGTNGISFGLGTNTYERIYWMSHLSTVKDTKFKEPAVTSRAKDIYFDSYSFRNWTVDGEEYVYGKPTSSETVYTPGWSYGKAKYDQITLSKETLGFENNNYAVMSFSGAFDQMAYDSVNKKVDQEKKAQLIAEFGGESKANDGVFVVGSFGSTEAFTDFKLTMPKINFLEQLKNGKIMSMEFGCRTDKGSVKFNGQELFKADNHHIYNLTRVKAYFYLEGSAVKVVFIEKSGLDYNSIYDCNKFEFTLDAKEANGTTGIVFSLGSNKYNRHYWFSHPRMEKGVTTLKDFHNKENVTVSGGVLTTITEPSVTSGAPYGQWKETCALSFDGIGVSGNAATPLTVNYGKINLNSIFAKGNGIRFTLGAWNGQEKLTFNSSDFGKNGDKPGNPNEHTAESIENTWRNFLVEITKYGMVVTNKSEGKEYIVSLSAGQLAGTEDITFNAGTTVSNGRFFYLSNIKEFHA